MSYTKYFITLSKLRITFSVCLLACIGFILNTQVITTSTEWSSLFLILFILILAGISASITNNLLDYDMDRKMNRAIDRQLAIDTLGKDFLWGFVAIILIIITFLTLFVFNYWILLLLLITFFSYTIWYTLFLKRNGPFGVILGGLPGALPIIIGGMVANSNIHFSVWLFFFLLMLWQPPHFWALSLHLKDEYKEAAVPVLPNVYGITVTKYFIYLYLLSLVPITLFLLFINGNKVVGQFLGFLVSLYYLGVSIYSLEFSLNYKSSFRASLVYLFLIIIILLSNHFNFILPFSIK